MSWPLSRAPWDCSRHAATRTLSVTRAASALPPPLLLVLDLDETLVRVNCKGIHNRKLNDVHFRCMVDMGAPPKVTSYECGVSIRPGLRKFLEWIRERRREGLIEGPWIFTTSVRHYVKALLRQIDPGGQVFAMRVLTREWCTPATLPGYWLKDLTQVPSKYCPQDTRRVLIVDNSPVSCIINPENSVLVRDWLGDDPVDTELERVQKLIDEVLECRLRCSGAAASDYAGRLMQINPGHDRFRERLQVLGAMLDASVPGEASLLRNAMREASVECNSIKEELLGAAP